MKSKLNLLVLSILLVMVGRAQQGNDDNYSNLLKPIEVLPPAPNAASLGKYGGINFNLSTGSMSTSIPVYTYSSRSLQLPLSISYNSNGFKVDEIASRIGVGWALNAGGVITRTVVGGADEYNTRLKPPGFTTMTRSLFDDFLEPISFSDNAGGYDAQPDRFSFNFLGYTGQFILDSAMTPIPLSYSNLKFEFNSASPASDWDFRVTNSEGIQFYFGGDSAREETDKDVSGPTCGWDPPEFFPTAYYLTKIVHPNNDSIILKYQHIGYNYRSNITQSVFYHVSSELVCQNPSYRTCPTLPNYVGTCVTWLTTSGYKLTEINSSCGGKLVFSYMARKDVPLDGLVSKIELFSPLTNDLLKVFDFKYDTVYSTIGSNSNNTDSTFGYRHFLMSFSERSPDSLIILKHQFTYNNLDELPKRMSFCQDNYGFFNGRTTNTGLLPKPSSLTLQTYFPDATANRDANSDYAKKGLLSKIIYPTGGADSIYYEGNTMYSQVQVGPPDSTFSVNADSEDLQGPATNYSDTISVDFEQEAFLYGSCTFYGSSSEEDPIHNKGRIYLYEDGSIIYQTILNPGQSITPNPVINFQTGKSYWIKVVASGTKVLVDASFSAKIGAAAYDTINKEVGGARVSKVITTDGITSVQQVKKYYYGNLDSLDKSSGFVLNDPVYIKNHTVKTQCEISIQQPPLSSYIDCQTNTCNYLAYLSTSQTNLYAFSGFITYRYVTESFGGNFENGGIEHTYSVVPDMAGTNVMNDFIVGAPSSNQSITNGREEYTHVFKKIGEDFISVKKTFNHFKDDNRYDSVYSAYVVNRKLGLTASCESNPPDIYEEGKYDVLKYNIYTNWSYIDTVTSFNYDSDGANYLTQTVAMEYNNPSHGLPTKISSYGSDQRINITNLYYPQDLSLNGSAETARLALVSRHIISPELKKAVLKDTSLIFSTTLNYQLFDNNYVLPANRYIQSGNNPSVKRLEWLKYDAFGNIIQQKKTDNYTTVYVWDYLSSLPIAEVSNADSASIAYTSFEAEGKGNWTYSGSVSGDATAPTGGTCYSLSSGNIAKTSLTSGNIYIVSYWSKSGSYTVSGSGTPRQGKTIDGWTYYEHEITGVTSVTISGTGYIDEVRLYPKGALMTTSAYTPLIGITAQCDVNNRITYYEYDSLGRLKVIKDQDKNVIKVIQYKYQASSSQF